MSEKAIVSHEKNEILALEIANRRFKFARKDITSFKDCLSDSLDNEGVDKGLEILFRRHTLPSSLVSPTISGC